MEIELGNKVKLHVSIAEDKVARKQMDDATAIHFEQLKNSEKCAAFAIYDGHGGNYASFYCRDNMMDFIKKEDDFLSMDTEKVKLAIKRGFLACHKAMRGKLAQWPKSGKGYDSTAGTTAALVIFRGKQIFIAHCGDSAVWMGYDYDEAAPWRDQQWKGINLTEEHKPETPKETRRILAAGGKITTKLNITRVVWTRRKKDETKQLIEPEEMEDIAFLNIARSLGDFWSWKESSKSYLVSPEPDVSVMNIDDFQYHARCLIIASDGVTSLMKPDEAAKLVHEFQDKRERGIHAGMLPAQLIVNRAIEIGKIPRRINADNASAIVIIPIVDDDELFDNDEIPGEVERPQQSLWKITAEANIPLMEGPERKRAIETTEDNEENHDGPAPAKKPKTEARFESENREIKRRHSERLAEREERKTRPRSRSLTS